MRRRRGSLKSWPPIVAALLAIAVAGALALGGALRGPERGALDLRFDIRGAQPVRDVAVVGIDGPSIQELGHWPFDRRWHARAVDELRKAGARLIVYDVEFTEQSPHPASDVALFEALGRAGKSVLAATTADPDGNTRVLGGEKNLREIGARAGATNYPTDRGAVIRRFQRAVGPLETMPVAAVRLLTGRGLAQDAFGADGSAYIDFRGPAGTIPTVSFLDLVSGHADPAQLRGRVVVVGATAASLQDYHPTAAGAHEMSGAELQANAIWTALHGNPLQPVATWLGVLAFLALGLAPALLMRRRVVLGFVGCIFLGAAYAATAVIAFSDGHVAPVAAPLTVLALSAIAVLAADYLAAANERALQARLSERLRVEVDLRTEQLRETQLEIVHRLAQAAERRDDDTGAHLERIGQMTELLALAAGLSRVQADLIRHASAMHDVGKIGIPDNVLRKPGKLTDEEWEIMRMHPDMGARILADSTSDLIQLAEQIARTHHERWDGSGYPQGLKGEQIPLSGRICAVCDVFDALTSERPYKRPWPVEEAVGEIRRQSGRHFDPRLTDLFVGLVERGEITAEGQPAPEFAGAPGPPDPHPPAATPG